MVVVENDDLRPTVLNETGEFIGVARSAREEQVGLTGDQRA